MTHLPLKTKLGTRLRHLVESIPTDTELVWDMCCDHGALGRAIIESRPQCQVIFNDIHKDIMARLKEQLIQLNAQRYRLAVCPAEAVSLEETSRQVVVIAGIGDEQTITILEALRTQAHAKNCTFIISPTTKVALVRQYLIGAGFYRVNESIVTENKRSYEVITVATQQTQHAQLMTEKNGDLIGRCWQPIESHRQHLKKLIGYYQGQALNPEKAYAKFLLQRYKLQLKNLNESIEKN
ncbi:tRNA (adenine(22)-N(1))-methyltransferase TrmK [Reinekea marina]|uniref:tRNA (Adenine(22)-N(1))-methyltransferase TrmK n=1 Tax=Reinekea marina TaxID=1310421 RepID=A0ABV7WNQ4_9GAMM|nr:tRNA (adenine(22)-N(1))-methyltransferase TrmK [Reinekea marina]MDN3648592.1 tRNA (adenine(22)-N(1))-methyltransferase TrmK [Reinekea marina]